MTDKTSAQRRARGSKIFKSTLTLAVSALALGLAVQTAYAADAPAADDNTVVIVKGVRGSLTASLNNKRKATQVVESVVAEDIGKLPDNNVVEALQRVSGVQVTDRAGGEVGTISIRGLPDITTTWNGRLVFTASNRQESLQDIPSTLVRQIDVYKTRAADQIEAGIAGQIDVSTLRPFDFKGSEVSVALRDSYLEPAKKWNPQGSILFSNRWHTSNGDFGALLNIADVKTNYRNESVTPGALVPFASATASQDPPGYTPLQRIFSGWPAGTNAGLSEAPNATLNFLGGTTQYPYLLSRDAIFQSDLLGDRDRPSANLALQWAPNDTSVYTFEFLYDGYRNTTFNNLLFSFVDWWGNLGPNPASTITLYPNTNIMKTRTVGAVYGFNSGDLQTNTTDSYVYALNGKWDLGKLKLNADLSAQRSIFHSEFTAMRIDRVANQIIVDFNQGDGLAAFHFDDNSLLTKASTWNVAQFYDNANRNQGSAGTISVNGVYTPDGGIFTKISAGVRIDDRNANENNRTQSDDAGLGRNLATLDSGFQYTTSGFWSGIADVPSTWMEPNGYYIRDHIDDVRNLYHSVHSGFRTTAQLKMHRTFDIDEKTTQIYLMADTDSQLFDHRLRTNWGVRYVNVSTDMKFYGWDNVADAPDPKTSGSAKKKTTKALPSLTIRYDASNDVVLRFNYGETLRRPNFGDLNPVFNLTGDLTNVGYGSGSGGNPDLQPTYSKNTDLTAEWYFSKDSSVYGTLFNRDIQGLVVPLVRKQNITGSGLNTNTFVVTQPVNASDGKLSGAELGVVYFPKWLPGILDGLGLQGSVTALSSSQNVPDTDTQGNIIGQEKTPFFGVSRYSYNATLAYEKGPVSSRLSYVWRNNFLARNEARLFANPIGIWRKPEKSLDFQFTYDINDKMSFDIDAVNITNEKQQEYYHFGTAGTPDTTNFGTVEIGRQVAVGFRWKM
ncbi:MAG TPA: TonB-dependent receptor [Asticcacaulis sp.]|nr:TonB-dependent receptor [Asticcacaulis sp.]